MHADDLCVCHEALSDLITLPLPRHALPTSLGFRVKSLLIIQDCLAGLQENLK